MPIFRPKELKKFLNELGVSPNKRMSQTFLIDGNIIKNVLAAAEIEKDDLIVEIGPGPGAITEAILDKGASVIAIEKDPTLANHLKKIFNNADVFAEDIITFPLEETIIKYNTAKKAKVIANIPYHLTGPIITKLLPLKNVISSIYLFVQMEVAKRICASPHNKAYGSLTLFVNFWSKPTNLFKVNKRSFFPTPKVDSAVVEFILKEPPLIENRDEFFVLTRKAFGQRRKMLRNALQPLFDSKIVEQALDSIGKSAKTRAEELTLDEFIHLYRRLNSINKNTPNEKTIASNL